MHKKFAVYTAIDTLIKSSSPEPEAASTLIEYAMPMSISADIIKWLSHKSNKNDQSISGLTTIGLEVSSTEPEKKHEENEGGYEGLLDQKVGQYRVWKTSESMIRFLPWKQLLPTGDAFEDHPALRIYNCYYLSYNASALKPIEFGEMRITKSYFRQNLRSTLLNFGAMLIRRLFPNYEKEYIFRFGRAKVHQHKEPRWKIE